ncbi:unnamed protein product [Amoebophrya sp. A120]|nr:unnamed protein product [Amoebophrya sp. A120]|eukprot:GSA120T00018184001.1
MMRPGASSASAAGAPVGNNAWLSRIMRTVAIALLSAGGITVTPPVGVSAKLQKLRFNLKRTKQKQLLANKRVKTVPAPGCTCAECEQGMLSTCMASYPEGVVNTCVARYEMRCVLPQGDPILQTDKVHDAATMAGTKASDWVGAEVPMSEFCLYECRPQQKAWPARADRPSEWKPARCTAIGTLRGGQLAAAKNGAAKSEIDLCQGDPESA